MNQSEKHNVDYRGSLTAGLIPLGRQSIPTKLNKAKFVELFGSDVRRNPIEWTENDHRWSRYNLITDILWYPARPVSFTFRDDVLVFVEAATSNDNRNWDYSMEIQDYLNAKKMTVEFLGKESRSDETDRRNMESVWEFGQHVLFVSCDARTGGAGIGLRTICSPK